MSRIQLISDLHIEGEHNTIIDESLFDYLVIAGDISANIADISYFFSNIAPKQKPIVYIIGNKEHEGKKIDDVPSKIKDLLKPHHNVHVLHNQSVVIDDIKFVGSTLWTNFEGDKTTTKEENKKWAKRNVSDFSNIFRSPENNHRKYRTISTDEIEKEFIKAIRFLEKEINSAFIGKKVIVTHFPPSLKSLPVKSEYNLSYWASNIEHIINNVDLWLHASTHCTKEYIINQTTMYCNPYKLNTANELSINHDFDVNKKITI